MPGNRQNVTTATDQLAERIREAKPGDHPFAEPLQTSERVLRRVTDGIYREPWAAIRELISNAYDADATKVTVSTDAPRFKRMTVRDNGNGFTAEALASMCKNIGGSPKRTSRGEELGVSAEGNPDLSPNGRRMIGKLGIGLFSVSQLTQQFRIVTKVKGSLERIVADIVLFRYAERRGRQPKPESDELETTGEIQITKIAARDKDAHGTDVIIDYLLPRTRTEFQSRDLWELVLNPPTEAQGGGTVIRPSYHLGYSKPGSDDQYVIPPEVPWGVDDDPPQRFRKLTDAMYSRAGQHSSDRKPSLATTFDNYFRFMWLVALSAPIDYLDTHPFDLSNNATLRYFTIGKIKSGRAEEVTIPDGQTLRTKMQLTAPERGGNPSFVVKMDDVELRRPIRFIGLPKSQSAVTTPLLFVGKDQPITQGAKDIISGGPLRFEAYLLWTPRVVPVEHSGVLIRIGDASGSLFDESFMRYQISEQKRKEQVTAEVFVHEGMDAALNIDRESFNHSHPHYQYIASWVHDAFKQFATKHKSIGSSIRKSNMIASQAAGQEMLRDEIQRIVAEWTDEDELPIEVEYVSEDQVLIAKGAKDVLVLSDAILEAAYPKGERGTIQRDAKYRTNQSRITAIAQLLHAARVLKHLTHEQQQKLLADVVKIIFFQGS